MAKDKFGLEIIEDVKPENWCALPFTPLPCTDEVEQRPDQPDTMHSKE
jgi:hypothetical protein